MKKTRISPLKAFALLPLALALAACGGGSSSSSSVPAGTTAGTGQAGTLPVIYQGAPRPASAPDGWTSSSLTGVVSHGVYSGGVVTVYALDAAGNRASILGLTGVDGKGQFSAKLTNVPSGQVEIVATGGGYASLWDGARVLVDSLASVEWGEKPSYSVNVFTDLGWALHKGLTSKGRSVTAPVALLGVMSSFGLTNWPGSTIPSVTGHKALTPLQTASAALNMRTAMMSNRVTEFSGLSAEETAGFGASVFERCAAIQSPNDRWAYFQALRQDIADGVMDGLSSGNAVMLNGKPIPGTAGSTELIRCANLVAAGL